MEQVRFTRHARNAMRFWRLTEADVLSVLTEPDTLALSVKGRLNAWKQSSNGLIRVTYIEELSQRVVITVTVVGPQHRPPLRSDHEDAL